MLEIIPASDQVVAMRASGRIDESDIERSIAAVEAALARQDRIALYAEIDIAGITPGALTRDIGYGLGKLRELHRFPRAAVVTDQEWVRWIARVEQAILPGVEVRIFPPAEKDAALAWASEPIPHSASELEPSEPSIRPIGTTKPGVIAFEVGGRVGADDTRRLITLFNEAMDGHERLRVLVRVRNFDGVTLEALRQEGLIEAKMKGWQRVERYAVVGGPAWMEGLARGAAPFVGIQTRHFKPEDEAQAWDWLGAKPSGQAAGNENR
ncbi:SpoIIAA family protein [Microvirga lenta]|uniref:STAS/SEC14 domain-containing protein n=1 Tax=Microvirga lenta TaxID=2881337 RepID=UPI001CFFC08E|nr:STAS/SEC14 domain-containing protein [Microvirga lenta]MCB5175846.1 STAS/SEC14 domain-containing protein [Microvirga lenta]